MELQSKDTALLFKVTHSQPIEMGDFVSTMNALSVLFENYVKKHADSTEGRKAKLYVEKIEHGSIEFYMVESIMACALPFVENFNSIFEFAMNLKDWVTKAINGEDETKLSISDLKALKEIFAITSNDPKGETTFGPVDKNNPSYILNNCECTFNFWESNSAQNQIGKTIERKEQESPIEIIHKKQLMTIYQLRGDMDTNKGNRAKIDALCPKDLSVYFDTEDLKREILESIENPIRQAYVVDVIMQTINGKPASYKVMDLHEILPLDE